MTSPTVASQQHEPSGPAPDLARRTLKQRLQQLLAFASLIAIFAFFSILSPNFLNYGNVTNILFSTVVIGTLALGTTFVIITHRRSVLAVTDKLLVLRDGQVQAFGPRDDVLAALQKANQEAAAKAQAAQQQRQGTPARTAPELTT